MLSNTLREKIPLTNTERKYEDHLKKPEDYWYKASFPLKEDSNMPEKSIDLEASRH